MKKVAFLLPILLLAAMGSFAQLKFISIDVIVGRRQPNPQELNLMRAEEGNHPNITQSMHDIENAIKHLNDAPDTFGGHKGQALTDLHQAWISLRRALYYRIYQDTH